MLTDTVPEVCQKFTRSLLQISLNFTHCTSLTKTLTLTDSPHSDSLYSVSRCTVMWNLLQRMLGLVLSSDKNVTSISCSVQLHPVCYKLQTCLLQIAGLASVMRLRLLYHSLLSFSLQSSTQQILCCTGYNLQCHNLHY